MGDELAAGTAGEAAVPQRTLWGFLAAVSVLGAVGGALGVLVPGGLLGSWPLLVGFLLVGAVLGAGAGLLLRRQLGWQDSAWAARRRELSWRQRLAVGWAAERGRPVSDPRLASAAVERGEFTVAATRRLAPSYRSAGRIVAVVGVGLAVSLAGLGVWFALEDSAGWLVVAVAVVLGGVMLAQPWLLARVQAWTLRRAERSLALNRDLLNDRGTS